VTEESDRDGRGEQWKTFIPGSADKERLGQEDGLSPSFTVSL
jgi:hypothetical protein